MNSLTLDIDTLFMLLDNCKLGIIITDGDGKILWGNDYYSTLADFNIKDYIGLNVRTISQENLVSVANVPIIDQILNSETPHELTSIVKYSSKDFIASTACPIINASGKIEYFVYSITNCSESIRMQSELNQLNARTLALESQLNELQTTSMLSKSIIVADEHMLQIYKTASRLAAVDTSIMILGESGVGKDVYAKYVHSISPRKDGNFIHVNLSAIPKSLFESELFGYEAGAFTGASKYGKIGLIELANGGTLFLDEIGELGLDIQAKLLQVVQDRKLRRVGSSKEIDLDIRIICATNRNLEQMVQERIFRLDLYYRLNVISVNIPPLRERQTEIPLLVNMFLERYNEKYHSHRFFDPNVMDAFLKHIWPGNIRELNHVVENLVVISNSDEITLESLPSSLLPVKKSPDLQKIYDDSSNNLNLKDATIALEKWLIREALKKHKTTTAAAKAMGIDISTLSKKRKKYNI